MALATSGLAFTGSAGLLLGMAQSGTTYAVVYGVIGRNVDASQALLGHGRGRGGRLVRPVPDGAGGKLADRRPGAGRTRCSCWAAWRWPSLPLAWGLRSRRAGGSRAGHQQSIGAALREAFGLPQLPLLMAGYFVCGFQVVFIGVHMPSYLKDQGLAPDVATTALALIGLFNVFGTYAAGCAGPAHGQALHPVGHLYPALGGHRGLPAGAADALERLRVRRR
jgi:hypothetical protein